MDKRIRDLILEIEFWLQHSESASFYDDGYELCNRVEALRIKMDQGRIASWASPSITLSLIEEIEELCVEIINASHDFTDLRSRLSYGWIDKSEVLSTSKRLVEFERVLNTHLEELRSIINGIINSNNI